jgi:hypothetical protein
MLGFDKAISGLGVRISVEECVFNMPGVLGSTSALQTRNLFYSKCWCGLSTWQIYGFWHALIFLVLFPFKLKRINFQISPLPNRVCLPLLSEWYATCLYFLHNLRLPKAPPAGLWDLGTILGIQLQPGCTAASSLSPWMLPGSALSTEA